VQDNDENYGLSEALAELDRADVPPSQAFRIATEARDEDYDLQDYIEQVCDLVESGVPPTKAVVIVRRTLRPEPTPTAAVIAPSPPVAVAAVATPVKPARKPPAAARPVKPKAPPTRGYRWWNPLDLVLGIWGGKLEEWEGSRNILVRLVGRSGQFVIGLVVIAVVVGIPLLLWLLMGTPCAQGVDC
jgi:hypothetical protein